MASGYESLARGNSFAKHAKRDHEEDESIFGWLWRGMMDVVMEGFDGIDGIAFVLLCLDDSGRVCVLG